MFQKRLIYKMLLLLILAGTCFFLFIHVYTERESLMTVSFLDVGQGDSILIETPNGTQMLIDAGINAKVLESLGKVMPFYDRHIDAIMLSHPDADHVGGFPEVVHAYGIGAVIRGSSFKENDITTEIWKRINDESKIKVVEQGDRIILDQGRDVYFQVFSPSETFPMTETNDMSIMGRLVYGETEIMFTGDASEKVETYIAHQYGTVLESDVLKVGHHGSKTSSSEMFIGFVKPAYAVISAGEDNSYGHPHQEVVDRLIAFGAEVLQTKDSGTIVMQSDGREIKIKD